MKVVMPAPRAKGFGVVIPPGGITDEYATPPRRQRREYLSAGDSQMAEAIANSLASRGLAKHKKQTKVS